MVDPDFRFEVLPNNSSKARVLLIRNPAPPGDQPAYHCGVIAFEEGMLAPVFQGGNFEMGYPPAYLDFLEVESMITQFWDWLQETDADLFHSLYFKPSPSV